MIIKMAAAPINKILKLKNTEVLPMRNTKVPTSIMLRLCHGFEEVKQMHAQLIVSGLIKHPLNPGRLIESYVSASQFCYALSVFDSIPFPDVFAYNNIIRGLMLGKFPNDSFLLYHELLSSGLKPDNHTYTFVLKTCSCLKALYEGKQVHGQIIKAGIKPNCHVQSSLIHMYSKCDCIEFAEKVLAETSGENVLPMNCMITGYFSCGHLAYARKMFNKMSNKDTATWSTMITGYTRNGMHAEAISIFQEMMVSMVPLNESTLVSALSACDHLVALDQGRWIHRYICKNDIKISLTLGSALVDMYAKCGCIDSSYEVFQSMPRKDAVTWGIIISGFSINGKARKCLELLNQMVENGTKPNEVIFVAILSACSHAGYVEAGIYYFNQMVHRFRIRPSMEHYSCMVDLLGRAGRLADAEELISSISGKPNPVIWGALISACRTHKDVTRGERAFKQLVELEAMSADRYKQVANFFTVTGEKEKANEAWSFLKNKKLDSASGFSSIEVDSVVHEFIAGDVSHKNSANIYEILDGTGTFTSVI